MRKTLSGYHADALCVVAALLLTVTSPVYGWRSALYPEDWTPADRDAQGRFFHDFSYAGYHRGEAAIPTDPPGLSYTVTDAPYQADNTGSSDATVAIQAAIDDATAAGGGIVYLPAGTYKVSAGSNSCCLRIGGSGVVLRGAGVNQTYICNTDTYMRSKSVILVQPPSGDWHSPLDGSEILTAGDISYPTRIIPLLRAEGLTTGDTVIVRADCTAGFIEDHGMTGKWNEDLNGPTFCRRITSIDPVTNTITIDIPVRYYLKTRDNARIYKVAEHLEEAGIEDLSVGMVQNCTPGWGDNDYEVQGTGAYEVHYSHAIKFKHARDCWLQRVATYRPAANAGDYHTLSNVMLVEESVNMTVRECVFKKPQYEGGGGNGYGFTLRGNDCLITDCVAVSCRHNYDLKSMWTSGNVIYRCQALSARLASDFHMHLSMANLFDSTTINGDYLQAIYRPYGTILHGHSTTESVFWNTYGEGSGTAIESRQWGWGYVIGTSGSRSSVSRGTADNTAPEDYLEGEGTGVALEPQSLYQDQFAKRMSGLLVKAGQDLTLFESGGNVSLSGTVYSYLDGSGFSHVWSQRSGPTAVIAEPHMLETTALCGDADTYVFRLTAWKGGVTNHDEVTIGFLSGSLAPLSSKDSIVGRRQANAPALGYYPGESNGVSGVSGSIYDSTRHDRNAVFGFTLPTLPAGTTMTNAILNFEITGVRDQANLDPSLHVYLLNTGTPESSGISFYFHGPGDSNAEVSPVGSAYIGAGTVQTNYADDQYDLSFRLSGDALELLKSFYGGDNVPDQSEAFFRFNMDVNMPGLTDSHPYERYIIDVVDDESSLFIEHTDPPSPGECYHHLLDPSPEGKTNSG